MKAVLDRVRGAVAKKNLLPILTSFCVQDGTIQGSNGFVTVGALCPELDIDFAVQADKFIKAIDACPDEPTLRLLDSGQLSISSGRFRARLPTRPTADYPQVTRLSGHADVPQELRQALQDIRPFIGTDAFRAWSHGVLVKDGYMWATNNVVLVRRPFTYNGPAAVWPAALVDELLRVKQTPASYVHTATHAEFLYTDGSWLVGSLIHPDWPDVEKFFNDPWPPLVGPDLPELLEAVETVVPFCPDLPVVQLSETGVETEDGETHASVKISGLRPARLRVEPFLDVLRAAEVVDFDDTPYRWRGKGMEGVLVGMR